MKTDRRTLLGSLLALPFFAGAVKAKEPVSRIDTTPVEPEQKVMSHQTDALRYMSKKVEPPTPRPPECPPGCHRPMKLTRQPWRTLCTRCLRCKDDGQKGWR